MHIYYRMLIENCLFPQFTATHPLHEGEQLIWYERIVTLLAGNFLFNQTQPSTGEAEVAKYWNYLKETQYLMNTLYLHRSEQQ